ncbi:MAG: SGNH/GDSL hydrolase family protein [Clostridiales bacterium]|nr:SGNH/GDSL hydrolase family protein [Clostridiales bacterium]
MLKFENRDRIVFTGDSVTDSGRGRPVGQGLWDGVGNGYVRAIDSLLAVAYPESIFHIMNTGSSGFTSRDLLSVWQRDVLDLKPDWVSVCIGFNDVWRQFDSPGVTEQHVYIDEFEENVAKMADLTIPRVKGMILLTPYYIETNTQDAMRAEMDKYGAVIKKIGAERNIPVVDLQKEFCDYLKYRHSSYIMWDRVHPGWVGSMIIARAVLKALGADRISIGG